MKNILILLSLLTWNSKLFSNGDTLTLQEKAAKAEYIFEGRVIADSSFYGGKTGIIYTAVFVLVSKEFKGSFTSDTMEVITIGGEINGIQWTCRDCWPWYRGKGTEGIFFCTYVKPSGYRGILVNSAYWPTISGDGDGYIGYDCVGKVKSGTHPGYCNDGTHYNDIEKEVYEPLEQILGTKYKQLRLDCLEQSAEGEK